MARGGVIGGGIEYLHDALDKSPSNDEAELSQLVPSCARAPSSLFHYKKPRPSPSLLFFLNQDHQLKSSPAGYVLYLVGDSDACVEIDSTPLLKPSSRGPLRGGSQDMATTYKMGHLDSNRIE